MLVTLNIKNESKKDSFLNFLATLDYIEIKSQQNIKKNNSEKKDKFKDFAGFIWGDCFDIAAYVISYTYNRSIDITNKFLSKV